MLGAGPWGLMCAWRAARAGAAVALVDDGRPPAAWVAAGMLGPWAEADERERPLHDLMRQALDAWPKTAAAITADGGRDSGLRRTGAVLTATRPEDLALVRRRHETLTAWGERFAWSSSSALRRVEPGLGPSTGGGLDLPDEHQVEPRSLLRALGAACAAVGVRRVAGSAAALPGRPVRGVRLADGVELGAGRVVLAAGHSAGRLAPRVPLRAVKGQVLRLRATERAALPIARTVRTPAVYLAPRDDEVVVGATMEERADATVTAGAAAELLEEALRAVPECAELALAEVASGLRPATPDGLPALGVDPDDDLVWAVGGYRHGILLAPLAAEAAVAAAAGDPPPPWAAALTPTRFAS